MRQSLRLLAVASLLLIMLHRALGFAARRASPLKPLGLARARIAFDGRAFSGISTGSATGRRDNDGRSQRSSPRGSKKARGQNADGSRRAGDAAALSGTRQPKRPSSAGQRKAAARRPGTGRGSGDGSRKVENKWMNVLTKLSSHADLDIAEARRRFRGRRYTKLYAHAGAEDVGTASGVRACAGETPPGAGHRGVSRAPPGSSPSAGGPGLGFGERSAPQGGKHMRFTDDFPLQLTAKEEELFSMLDNVVQERGLNSTLRIAGGWVRDKLLEFEVRRRDAIARGDEDLVWSSPPADVTSDVDVAIDNMYGAEFACHLTAYLESKRKGESFCVGVIRQNPERSKHRETANVAVDGFSVDFVNLRTEGYADDSRIPSMMGVGTAQEDAMRRDLTINSLFYNLRTRRLEDLTGRGFEDFSRGLVDTPLAPRMTLLDDPLRVLRAVRFAARLGFDLSEMLLGAAADPAVHEALSDKVSAERRGAEFDAITQCIGDTHDRPSPPRHTQPAKSREPIAESLADTLQQRLRDGEGCLRVVSALQLLQRCHLIRVLFHDVDNVNDAGGLSPSDLPWPEMEDAIVRHAEALHLLVAASESRAPTDTVAGSGLWRKGAAAVSNTLRRAVLASIFSPMNSADGPLAAIATPLPRDDARATSKKPQRHRPFKVSQPVPNKATHHNMPIVQHLILKSLKRSRREAELVDLASAVAADKGGLRRLAECGAAELPRVELAMNLREIGEAWPIAVLAAGASLVAQEGGDDMGSKAESVAQALDASVEWMVQERLLPGPLQQLSTDFDARLDLTSPAPEGRRHAGDVPWLEKPAFNGNDVREFGISGVATAEALDFQLRWQFANPLPGRASEEEEGRRIAELREELAAWAEEWLKK